MTVVAARKYSDRIEMACDSQSTIGYRKEKSAVKIKFVNEMIIGGCGASSETQWLFTFAKNHKPVDATEQAVSEFMQEFYSWMRAKDNTYSGENSFLLIVYYKLFHIYDQVSVFEIEDYTAIGSGGQYALAALYLDHSPQEAVEVAKELCIYCSGKTLHATTYLPPGD